MAFWAKDKQTDPGAPLPPQSPVTTDVPSVPALSDRFEQLMQNASKMPAIDVAIKISDLILEHAVLERASDVHLEQHGQNTRVRFRVDGTLQDVLFIPKNKNFPVTQRIRVLAGFDPEPPSTYRTEEGRFQKIISSRAIQVRVSAFPTINGEKLVLRILDRAQMGLALNQLGLNASSLETLKRITRSPYGIFFITGSTGSGKTTTLYAMIKAISNPMINVMTLEDPVEYRLEGINQAQINMKSGFGWTEGLNTILRQDPDVVMVGEIRDNDSAEISMRAALTGHLLLATLHTISAPGVIERLYEMNIQPFLIASSMLGSMSQRLVRKVCPSCSKKANPLTQKEVSEFIKHIDPVEAGLVEQILLSPNADFRIPKGCPACKNTGYIGRTGIFEIMIMNEDLRKKVLEHANTDDLRRTAITMGMRSMLIDGMEKASQGVTSLTEVIRVTATMV